MRRIVMSFFGKIWTFFTLRINVCTSWTKINPTFKSKSNISAFRDFNKKKKFKPSRTSALSVLQVVTSVVIHRYWSEHLEDRDRFNTPSHWRCQNPHFLGSFSEPLLQWTRQRRRNFGAVFLTFQIAFRTLPVLGTARWKSLVFHLKIVVFGRNEFVHFFLNIRMPRYDKKSSGLKFS